MALSSPTGIKVQVQDAGVRVRVALQEVQRQYGPLGENHLQVFHGQPVGAGRLHLAVVREVVLAQEDEILVQNHVSAFHVNGLGKIVDLFVMNLPIDVFVGINLFLPVRNDVGHDNLVINHKTHVAGENLVAVLHQTGAVHLDVIFQEDGLEGRHLPHHVLFLGIHAVFDRLVGFAVVSLFQRGNGTAGVGHSKHYFAESGSLG